MEGYDVISRANPRGRARDKPLDESKRMEGCHTYFPIQNIRGGSPGGLGFVRNNLKKGGLYPPFALPKDWLAQYIKESS
jgi:hypothetical protein